MNFSADKMFANPRFAKAFGRDAGNAYESLRKAKDANELLNEASTFHRMKSALGYMGLIAESEMAAALEREAKLGNSEFVSANIDSFIEMIGTKVALCNETLNACETETAQSQCEKNAPELSHEAIAARLKQAKLACDDYDEKTAYGVFDSLLIEKIPDAVRKLIEEWREMLHLNSDFDVVGEMIERF